jgi:predicted outer membrane repeat protein
VKGFLSGEKYMRIIIVVSMLLAMILSFVKAETIFVPSDFATIQAGIDAAMDEDTVLVASGIYAGDGNRDIDFTGKEIVVMSEYGPGQTIIDCEGSITQHRGFYFHNNEGSETILDGFTVTNGQEDYGGAILCTSSSPTVFNCILSGNHADYSGGGMACDNSSPVLMDCTITQNTAETYGGGIYCTGSRPVISGCMVNENTTSGYGGGISMDESSPHIDNCIVNANEATYTTGGIYCTGSSPVIRHCTISHNVTSNFVGAITCDGSPCATITNCIIAENSAEAECGAILCRGSDPVITNCTFYGNTANTYTGGIYCESASPIITNCILWEDSLDEIYITDGNPVITYTDIEGGWEGEGNIDSIPLFIDPLNDDFYLQNGSPCIDTGDPYSRLDLDESRNDMGAYGGTGNYPEGVIGGHMSGILELEESPYIVAEDVIIDSQDTLRIESGVILQLHNYSGFTVFGALVAQGTEEQPVTCTTFQPWDKGKGIRFIQSSGELSFCIIENCYADLGGGIYCDHSNPPISDCTVSGNIAKDKGGGIYCIESSPDITRCTISGNAGHYCGGIYCYSNSNPVINGCNIDGNSGAWGAGIGCCESSPDIIDCTISENTGSSGGGICCKDGSSPVIHNCIISGNISSCYGGGIDCDMGSSPAITHCTISSNSADCRGGGIYCNYSTLTITDCTILNNSSYELGGGGIYHGTSPFFRSCMSLENSMVSGNSAVGSGGGILCDEGSLFVDNCSITNNVATEDGGGIFHHIDEYYNENYMVIRNSIVALNRASDEGGGIYRYHSNPFTILNSTITGNIATNSGGGVYSDGSYPFITGSIFWNDTPEEIDYSSENPVIVYTDFDGGWPGEGNINADPLFADPEYHLQEGSPCIDTGDPYMRMDEDNSQSDMGAYGGRGDLPPGVLGGITSGTLTQEGSPYVVSEDIVVQPNDTLTIEAGITLQMHNRSGIFIYGTLVAEGTDKKPITITRFKSWDLGGGLQFLEGSGDITFTTVEYGESYYAGGIYCNNAFLTLSYCTIRENAGYHSGGIYCCHSNPIITNCIISDNSNGGGMYCYYSDPILINCTIAGNEPGFGFYCEESSPTITSSIVWDAIQIYSGTPVITYSDIKGGSPGEGNIDEDPCFVDSENGNFHLMGESPCIDSATAEGAPEFDIDYDERPLGDGYDMGVDEYTSLEIAILSSPSEVSPGNFLSYKVAINNKDLMLKRIDSLSLRVEGPVKTTLTLWSGLATLKPEQRVVFWIDILVKPITPPGHYICDTSAFYRGEFLGGDYFECDVVPTK